MVPLFVKGLLERGLPLTWAARLLAENPARHFRIDHRKGGIAVGRDADLTVLHPVAQVYDAKASRHSIAGWSPYDGITLPWSVAGTWLRGQHVFDGTDVLAKPGNGQFIRPPRPLGLRGPIHA